MGSSGKKLGHCRHDLEGDPETQAPCLSLSSWYMNTLFHHTLLHDVCPYHGCPPIRPRVETWSQKKPFLPKIILYGSTKLTDIVPGFNTEMQFKDNAERIKSRKQQGEHSAPGARGGVGVEATGLGNTGLIMGWPLRCMCWDLNGRCHPFKPPADNSCSQDATGGTQRAIITEVPLL